MKRNHANYGKKLNDIFFFNNKPISLIFLGEFLKLCDFTAPAVKMQWH